VCNSSTLVLVPVRRLWPTRRVPYSIVPEYSSARKKTMIDDRWPVVLEGKQERRRQKKGTTLELLIHDGTHLFT
jgi:hypothetical protein